MYCRKCGTPNPDDRSSCLQCNAPLTSSLPQKPGSGPVNSGPMQTQTTPTSAFTEQPASPTVIIPSQQSSGRPTPTTGPITNPTPPPYQPYQQQPPQPYQPQQPPGYQQQSQPFQQSMQQSAPAQMNYGAPPPQALGQTMNVLAIISLVSGIIGLFACLCGVLAVPAIGGLVMGFIAFKKVQETGEKGKELAIAGMVTGGLGLLIFIGWIIFVVILQIGGGRHF